MNRTLVVVITVTVSILTLSYFRKGEEEPKVTTMRNIDSSNVIRNDKLTENHLTVNSEKMENYIKAFEGTNSSVLYNGNAILSDINELPQGDKELRSYILAYSLPVYMTYRVQNGVIINYSTLSFEQEDTRLQTIEKLFKEENVNLTIPNLKARALSLDAGEQDVIYKDEHRYVTLSKVNKSYKLVAVLTSEDNTEYDDKIYVTDVTYGKLLEELVQGIQDLIKAYTSSFEFKNSSPDKFGYYTVINIDSKNKLAYKIEAPNLEESNKLSVEIQLKGNKNKLKVVLDSFLSTLNKTLINNVTYEDLLSTTRTIEEINVYIDKAFSAESKVVKAELVSRIKGISEHYNKLSPYSYKLNLSEKRGKYVITFETNLFRVEDNEGGI